MNTSFGHKLRLTIAALLIVVTGVFILTQAVDVFLLLFAGILGALFIRALAEYSARFTGWSDRMSVASIIVLFAALVVGITALFANTLTAQVSELSTTLPQAISDIQTSVPQAGWVQSSFEALQQVQWQSVLTGEGTVISRISSVLSGAVGAMAGILITMFVSLYLALEPNLYHDGFLKLFSHRYKDTAESVMGELSKTLRWWMVGKSASMLVVGMLTALGLWAIGMPLVFVLALIAGLFSFIPNFGPIISAVPALLIGFSISPMMALWVLGVYVSVQFVESYIITPVINERTIKLPPAFLLLAQVMFAVLFGFLGILFAAPLSAVVVVLTRELYVKRYVSH